ncbi:MAG: gamma carbonic anhydrase family protein [Clostridiales bacterium]|nr:gamma carbonic anhydrase family protein [Clostridiales bacterium]
MGIHELMGKRPRIDENCFVAESADIIGDVTIGAGSSVWFGAVIRGDMAPVVIGQNVNIQDNSVVHVSKDAPTIIGDNVSVGHSAVVHGATIEDTCLIGMGAIVLDGAHIGRASLIGGGALVPPRKNIPPRSQALGSPCAITKELGEQDEQVFMERVNRYRDLGAGYLREWKNQ